MAATYEVDDVLVLAGIDPAMLLEILPPKIALRRRRVAELALDLSVARENPFVEGHEIALLARELHLHQHMLSGYERRLSEARAAVEGKESL